MCLALLAEHMQRICLGLLSWVSPSGRQPHPLQSVNVYTAACAGDTDAEKKHDMGPDRHRPAMVCARHPTVVCAVAAPLPLHLIRRRSLTVCPSCRRAELLHQPLLPAAAGNKRCVSSHPPTAAARMATRAGTNLFDLPCPMSAAMSTRRCKDFDANFGHVELRAATPAQQAAAGLSENPETAAAEAAPPPVRRPPPGPPPLENCAPLTGRLRVHWQVRLLFKAEMWLVCIFLALPSCRCACRDSHHMPAAHMQPAVLPSPCSLRCLHSDVDSISGFAPAAHAARQPKPGKGDQHPHGAGSPHPH